MTKDTHYGAIGYFLIRAAFIGLSFKMILTDSKQDSWLSILIAVLIGMIPLLLIKYIASYNDKLPLKEKCVKLFPKCHFLIIGLLIVGVLWFAIINFGNLIMLTNNQFLDKTPQAIIGLAFLIPIILILHKENEVIARVAHFLIIVSIALFILSCIGLIFNFNLTNFEPVMNNQLLPSTITFLGFSISPLFLLLMFPNYKGLNKFYLIGCISLLLTSIIILGVLGIDLALIYQYPEFHILKNSYSGVISFQLANILAIQWLLDIFILCVVSLKFCNSLANVNKCTHPIIMLIISLLILSHYEVFNTLVFTYSSYIMPIFWAFIIILFSVKVFIKKNRSNPISSTN